MLYSSSLTDKQWSIISGYFGQGNYGNRSKHDKRLLVDAILYITKSGCQWRQLPNDFPPWQTVYSFFRRAKQKNVWQKVLQILVKINRINMGKSEAPTYGIIDSQSVKTAGASKERGFDGGKKEKRS